VRLEGIDQLKNPMTSSGIENVNPANTAYKAVQSTRPALSNDFLELNVSYVTNVQNMAHVNFIQGIS
jgi:hypothetical protein